MAMPVTLTTSSALKLASGTTATTDGTAAIAINATSQPCQEVVVQADPDNVPDMLVGTSASLYPIQLTPGQSMRIRTSNVRNIFFTTATNGVSVSCNWLAEV